MIVRDLFHKYGCNFIAERAAQFMESRELTEKLLELAHEICQAEPAKNDWFLSRSNGKLCIYDVPGSEGVFRSMTAAEIAGLDASEIFPQKLKDAVELLEEYAYFRLSGDWTPPSL